MIPLVAKTFNITSFIKSTPLDKPKIIDVFPYNGEIIAHFRLEKLYDHVDEFIIIESDTTFSGIKKGELHFESEANRQMFQPFMSKITYVVVKEFPPYKKNSSWLNLPKDLSEFYTQHIQDMLDTQNFWRANYQRMFSKFFIRPSSSEGYQPVVLACDMDEIPYPKVFPEMINFAQDQHTPIFLFMTFFYYNFNTVNVYSWRQAYGISLTGYLDSSDMLSARIPHPDRLPDSYFELGGWHLSYFMSLDDIKKKLNSIADQSVYNFNPLVRSNENILYCIRNSVDLFHRNDHNFPLAGSHANATQCPKV